jgi:hypothetical protein
MTISSYQIDSVISAYNKQNRVKMRSFQLPEEAGIGKQADVVSLSQKGVQAAEAYKKISYSLIDVIMKEKDSVHT